MPFPGPLTLPDPGLLPGSTGTFTEPVVESLASLNDPAGQHALWIQAVGSMFEEVAGIVVDRGDPDTSSYVAGWSVLLDPVNCPTKFLPYLASFVGATVPPGTDDATARSLITQEQGFARGTPASIVAAVQRTLTGTQSCALLERTPDPYAFQIVVRPEEVVNLQQTIDAINSVKPAGLVFTINQTDGWTLFQMEAAYISITALESAFLTITGIESDQVGH